MDIRIEKTKNAIREAFLHLRQKKPLEKISVRELCSIARINKSTFYSHYRDIYDLSDSIEQETIQTVLNSIAQLDYSAQAPEVFAREILDACLTHLPHTMEVFSASDIHQLGSRIDRSVRELIYQKYPEYQADPRKEILLTFCIMGAHYAYWNHADLDRELLINSISELIRQMQPLL